MHVLYLQDRDRPEARPEDQPDAGRDRSAKPCQKTTLRKARERCKKSLCPCKSLGVDKIPTITDAVPRFEPRRGRGRGRARRPTRPSSGCGKLYRVRSRLYRSKILQENMRSKALAEIYTMRSFAQLKNLPTSLGAALYFASPSGPPSRPCGAQSS